MLGLGELLIVVVALEHFAFLVLEMFLWTTPTGRRVFRLSETNATISAALAKNMGLYNGFIGAGLLFGLYIAPGAARTPIVHYFLGCVFIAGAFGAVTVGRQIFFVQAIPAALAFAAVILAP